MKQSIKLLGILIVILAYGSCKKKTSDTQPHLVSDYLKFSTTGLQYIKPPVNSYFIYRDSASGLLDSVVVTESSIEKKLHPEHLDTLPGWVSSVVTIPDHYYEELHLKFTKVIGSISENWLTLGASNIGSEGSLFGTPDSSILLSRWDKAYTNSDGLVCFYYPFLSSISTTISSITIQGKIYNNVEKFSYERPSVATDSTIRFNYYWVKGIGLIKREEVTTNTNHSWSLIRNG